MGNTLDRSRKTGASSPRRADAPRQTAYNPAEYGGHWFNPKLRGKFWKAVFSLTASPILFLLR